MIRIFVLSWSNLDGWVFWIEQMWYIPIWFCFYLSISLVLSLHKHIHTHICVYIWYSICMYALFLYEGDYVVQILHMADDVSNHYGWAWFHNSHCHLEEHPAHELLSNWGKKPPIIGCHAPTRTRDLQLPQLGGATAFVQWEASNINQTYMLGVTIWLFNIAMENGPFIDDFPIKTSIYKGFSMAMLNNQMVYQKITIKKYSTWRW